MNLPDLSDLIADLQTAKEIAIKNDNANALVTATMAQAKLLGLDKQTIEHTVNDVQVISIERTIIDPVKNITSEYC